MAQIALVSGVDMLQPRRWLQLLANRCRVNANPFAKPATTFLFRYPDRYGIATIAPILLLLSGHPLLPLLVVAVLLWYSVTDRYFICNVRSRALSEGLHRHMLVFSAVALLCATGLVAGCNLLAMFRVVDHIPLSDDDYLFRPFAVAIALTIIWLATAGTVLYLLVTACMDRVAASQPDGDLRHSGDAATGVSLLAPLLSGRVGSLHMAHALEVGRLYEPPASLSATCSACSYYAPLLGA